MNLMNKKRLLRMALGLAVVTTLTAQSAQAECTLSSQFEPCPASCGKCTWLIPGTTDTDGPDIPENPGGGYGTCSCNIRCTLQPGGIPIQDNALPECSKNLVTSCNGVGQGCVESYRKYKYDCTVSDCHMTGLNGDVVNKCRSCIDWMSCINNHGKCPFGDTSATPPPAFSEANLWIEYPGPYWAPGCTAAYAANFNYNRSGCQSNGFYFDYTSQKCFCGPPTTSTTVSPCQAANNSGLLADQLSCQSKGGWWNSAEQECRCPK